jgi:diguanylate cyclase (GGDEF)-like protein
MATLAASTLVVLRFVRLVNDLNRATEELSIARNEILQQSVLDPLTGAYNRLVLPDQLDELAVATTPSSAVLSIDLDHFKQINDRWGHHAGDVVLGAVAQRLRACTRDRDVVIRMGGDEFLIILHDVEPTGAVELATRIVSNVEQPIEFHGEALVVSASVGIAMVRNGGADDTEDLLHRADAAMYAAKRSERAVELATP